MSGMTQDGEHIPPIKGDPPCSEYDPAGVGAGLEPDAMPQCAACGHPWSAHKEKAETPTHLCDGPGGDYNPYEEC